MYPANPGLRVVSLARTLVAEQIQYRELLLQMVKRDLLLRYKQTVMGFGWAVFMPLVNTVVFSLVFTRIAAVDTGMPYPVYAYTGLLAWNFTASSLRFAVTSLTSNANLVSKVYFPREIFPFSAVIVALADAIIASVLLAAMLAWYGLVPGWPVLLLPIVLVVHIALTTALALLLAVAHLFFRDVKYLFDIVLNVAMFATCVVYPIDRIGGRVGALLALNPFSTIIDSYRWVLVQHAAPASGPLLASAAIASCGLACAWVLFHRGEMQFAERI